MSYFTKVEVYNTYADKEFDFHYYYNVTQAADTQILEVRFVTEKGIACRQHHWQAGKESFAFLLKIRQEKIMYCWKMIP